VAIAALPAALALGSLHEDQQYAVGSTGRQDQTIADLDAPGINCPAGSREIVNLDSLGSATALR
jgi:hypothetical protein